ncbi:MAG TPA: hypothetical protein VMV10_21325 [Pirellulales bacterium]|nr:hypothetical protein [Pirellulales bacterium]
MFIRKGNPLDSAGILLKGMPRGKTLRAARSAMQLELTSAATAFVADNRAEDGDQGQRMLGGRIVRCGRDRQRRQQENDRAEKAPTCHESAAFPIANQARKPRFPRHKRAAGIIAVATSSQPYLTDGVCGREKIFPARGKGA